MFAWGENQNKRKKRRKGMNCLNTEVHVKMVSARFEECVNYSQKDINAFDIERHLSVEITHVEGM